MSKRREKPKDTRELAALVLLHLPAPVFTGFKCIIPLPTFVTDFSRFTGILKVFIRYRAIKYYAIDCKGTDFIHLSLSLSGLTIFEFKIGGCHLEGFCPRIVSYCCRGSRFLFLFPRDFDRTSTVSVWRIDKRVNSIKLMNFYSLRLLFSFWC